MKPLSTIYRGLRVNGVDAFFVDEPGDDRLRVLAIAPSQRLANKCSRFEWGVPYESAAQLSLAILLDFTGDGPIALQHHDAFKWRYVVGMSGNAVDVAGATIAAFLLDQGVDQNALPRTEPQG